MAILNPRYGEFFLKQNRSDSFRLKACVALCIGKYIHNVHNIYMFKEYISMSQPVPPPINLFIRKPSIHAEENALREVLLTEKIENAKCTNLELYISMSPCKECCDLIIQFLSVHPWCNMIIKFSSIYRLNDEQHISALMGLRRHRNVKDLDVFGIKEWILLRNRGILVMTRDSLRSMNEWDRYWRDALIQAYVLVPEGQRVHQDIGTDGGDSVDNFNDELRVESQMMEMPIQMEIYLRGNSIFVPSDTDRYFSTKIDSVKARNLKCSEENAFLTAAAPFVNIAIIVIVIILLYLFIMHLF